MMIASAITVGSNGSIVPSSAETYGILLVILFSHGIVCSAATNVLARLNLFYVIINGIAIPFLQSTLQISDGASSKVELRLPRSSLCSCALVPTRCRPKMHLPCSRITPVGQTVCRPVCYVEVRLIVARWLGIYVVIHCAIVDAHWM